MQTCELDGFGPAADRDRDLVEWDDGEYEGRLTVDILRERPDRQLYRDGCPGGESPEQVATRADRIVERVRRVAGDILLFSSAHFLRVLAARWIGGGTNFWQIIHAKHGEPERAGIRKQLGATRNSTVERCSSCTDVKGTGKSPVACERKLVNVRRQKSFLRLERNNS